MPVPQGMKSSVIQKADEEKLHQKLHQNPPKSPNPNKQKKKQTIKEKIKRKKNKHTKKPHAEPYQTISTKVTIHAKQILEEDIICINQLQSFKRL